MARQFAEVTFLADNREDLERVTVPSLIVQVSDDVVAPMEVGRYLRARLADSTFRVIQGTGHCPHVSHPAETVAIIREYLSARRSEPVPA
jgi:sigma-B regulation protein RsbQ